MNRWGTLVAVAMLAVLSGCGGSDGGDSLTKAQLNTKAGALCKASSREFDAIAEPANIEDPAQAATYLGKLVALADTQLKDLRALKPDDSVKAAYDDYLEAGQATRDFFQRVLDKAKAKDPSGLQELQQEAEQGNLQKRNEAAARKAGLTICAANEAQDEKHVITVNYEPPQTKTEQVAQELLKLGGTDGVAEGFSKNFAFPVDVAIDVRRGDGSPHYDPSTKTVNLFYSFIDETAGIIRRGQPKITDAEFGKQIAAVDAFILIHELGHMFVDVFAIPITGREEDAVDGMATVFFTDAVPNGLEYAFDAARFFKFLQDVQGAPDVRQFQDEHGLSIQRAFDIVCSVAGHDEAAMAQIGKLGILSPERLQRCPAEYQQKSRSWQTLLRPHLRSSQ
jgi:hypothetical protein